MIRVGIIGATGYAGAELVRILSGHPEFEIEVLTSRAYAGMRFDKVFPSMANIVDLKCEKLSVQNLINRIDAVFLALPHKIPMEIIPELVEQKKKTVDLSADFRFDDPMLYESCYQPHTAKDLLKKSVYGLCEIYYEKIINTTLVGNPGCYPTSILLPLVPLLKDKIIKANSIVADSKSGVSGAGRSPSMTTHFCEANESLKAYNVTSHRHNPEIDEVLSKEAGTKIHVTFVPHLIPMTRGMYTTIYADINDRFGIKDIYNCVESFYEGRKFVRICRDDRLPDTLHVRGTNYCDIGFRIDRENNRLIIISVLDNLVKGAAGQAVQNMNIMFGLDETTGLVNVPYPV